MICLTIKLAIASLKTSLSFESSPGSSRTLPTPCSTHQTISPEESHQTISPEESHQTISPEESYQTISPENLIEQSHEEFSKNNLTKNSQKNLDWFSSPAGHNPAGGD